MWIQTPDNPTQKKTAAPSTRAATARQHTAYRAAGVPFNGGGRGWWRPIDRMRRPKEQKLGKGKKGSEEERNEKRRKRKRERRKDKEGRNQKEGEKNEKQRREKKRRRLTKR